MLLICFLVEEECFHWLHALQVTSHRAFKGLHCLVVKSPTSYLMWATWTYKLCNRAWVIHLFVSSSLSIAWLKKYYLPHSAVQSVSSVAQSCLTLQPHGMQHARLPCPSPAPRVYSNSCSLCQWCHPTISSSVIPFSCLQSFPASGSFQMSQLFASGGQSIGVSASASALPINIQNWFPSGWTGWISLQSKGFSRVFSNATVQKHQFFSTQLSL